MNAATIDRLIKQSSVPYEQVSERWNVPSKRWNVPSGKRWTKSATKQSPRGRTRRAA